MPLLVGAAAFLGAAARLGPAVWGRRGRRHPEAVTLAAFPAVGIASAVYGIVLAVERKPPPGGPWLTLALAAVLGLPAVFALMAASRPARPDLPGSGEPAAGRGLARRARPRGGSRARSE